MRKISNPKLLKRNRTIGNAGQIGGMVVLMGGLAVSFWLPERLDLSWYALIIGFFCITIGQTFTNRWGRTPPPDEAVDNLLKGLDNTYTVVHFRLGADHALFTPNGIAVIVAKYERGTIIYDGKKWKQSGVSGLMKFFGTEAVGNPTVDGQMEADSLVRKLKKILKTDDVPTVRPLVAFVNEKTRVEAPNAPVPALHASQVKEYVRRLPKLPGLSPEQFQKVLEYAGEKNKAGAE
jgi:hypothetical protein